ncbi:hypothetical protein [Bacillus sp. NPDC094106]|uniref:hypothetical protein n=1 Tax=Bacillus sp. NPDC094106 TaxID=3363949 RepID=UPI003816E92D
MKNVVVASVMREKNGQMELVDQYVVNGYSSSGAMTYVLDVLSKEASKLKKDGYKVLEHYKNESLVELDGVLKAVKDNEVCNMYAYVRRHETEVDVDEMLPL